MSRRLLLEGDNLNELRQHIYDEFGAGARIVKAEQVLTGGIGGFFRKKTFELTVDVPDKPAQAKTPRTARKATQVVAPRAEKTFDEVLNGVRAMAGGASSVAAASGIEQPTPAASAARSEPSPVATAAKQALIDLGIPERYLADDGMATFLARLERAPELRRVTGSVIAVAGTGTSAVGTATQIADKLAITDIVHIGLDQEITKPNEVRAWRVEKRSTTVICVHVGPELDDVRAAALLIAAANPMQVWAVVDARTKSADLRRWLDALGTNRAIDALAVRAVTETLQPGTVLDLGVPVGLLDGAAANRIAWAAVLADRLADDTTV